MAGRFQAQSVASGFAVTCPALSELEQQYGHQEQRPSGPRIVVAHITFAGVTQVPPSEQREIAAAVEQQTSGYSVEGATDEAVERARAAWLDRGYFEAKTTGKVINVRRLPAGQSISVQVQVDEGLQYRLGEITFKGNRAIRDTVLLRGFFPIKDGDIFSRVKVAEGLENLRRAHGELGYLNFTSVPETLVDDQRLVISLVVDIDEGKQFHDGSVKIIGLDESARQEILKGFPIGQIYNEIYSGSS